MLEVKGYLFDTYSFYFFGIYCICIYVRVCEFVYMYVCGDGTVDVSDINGVYSKRQRSYKCSL